MHSQCCQIKHSGHLGLLRENIFAHSHKKLHLSMMYVFGDIWIQMASSNQSGFTSEVNLYIKYKMVGYLLVPYWGQASILIKLKCRSDLT